MRIRKKLQITVVVSLLTALVICLVLFMALYRLDRANNAEKIADEIMAGILERVTFRNDYIRNNTSRARAQWLVTHEEIGKLLKSAAEDFREAEDRENIAGMLKNHEAIGNIFYAIVASREKGGPSGASAELAREVEDRLVNQLNMRVYDIVIHSRNLLESSGKARVSALRLAGWGVVSSLLLMIAAVLINSWTMGRAIADRAARLREGASKIGSGDLEHRIDIKGDDEFAEVSQAFDAMTVRLSDSYLKLAEEVEERKRAEESLGESEERLQQSLRVSRSFAFEWKPATDQVLRSDSCATILDLSGSEAAYDSGQGYFQRLHPDDRAQFLQMLRDLTPASNAYVTEYRVQRDDGSIVVLEEIGQAIFDVTGNMERLVGVATDITERKRFEEELRENRAKLEAAHGELVRLLEERTRELRGKEVLLKEIHHRVKNNLQVISSLVGLQADGSEDETVRAGLRDITHRVRSMALVHEKLYQSADLAHIDFAEYSRGLLNYLWRAHGAASVRLTLDLSPVSFPVDSAVPLGLILNELAGNALKHAFRGRSEGEVTVSLHNYEEGRISLIVADNGVGLPEGLDWRQANTLGLRLVQMLSGQLGAEVKVECVEGTRFEIRFGV